MTAQTVATQHTVTTQKTTNSLNANGGTGYAKNQKVHRDGAIWFSRIDNNLYPPGEHHSWELYS